MVTLAERHKQRSQQISRALFKILIGALVMPVLAWADIRPFAPGSQEEVEAARHRLYPGGMDEEDLQVLSRLPTAERRLDAATLRAQALRGRGQAAPARPAPPSSATDESELGD